MMEIVNRQASHNYFITDTYEAGIVLTGTEIKSIRNGKCNIKDSYAIVKNNVIIIFILFFVLLYVFPKTTFPNNLAILEINTIVVI